jgi:hypothetical protein
MFVVIFIVELVELFIAKANPYKNYKNFINRNQILITIN